MNNNFGSLIRYLIDQSYDAHLFLFDNDFFHPQENTLDNVWEKYTTRLSWGSLDSFKIISEKKIKGDLKGYNFFIGCGSSPAFLLKAGIILDVFIPYGADLYKMPFFRILHPKRMLTMLSFYRCQRLGIKNSKRIFMAPTGGILENILNKIEVPKEKVFRGGVPMIYYKELESEPFKKFVKMHPIYHTIQKLKKDGKYIIFHNSRHCWSTFIDDNSFKGNNFLFEGLQMIENKKLRDKLHIITYEYGVDVEASKKLISRLNIEDNVTWIKKSPRTDVLAALSQSDIFVGQLALSYFSYGTIYEALALEKIIIHNRPSHIYRDSYSKLYPMIHADSSITVANALLKILEKGVENINIGKAANSWFKKHLIEEPLDEINRLINNEE